MKETLATILVVSLLALAAFGLLAPMSAHEGHSMHCPFAVGETTGCATSLAHLTHWQDVLVAIAIEYFVFVGVVLTVVALLGVLARPDPHYLRYRLRTERPIRPPLLQELYSQGTLNRKELLA